MTDKAYAFEHGLSPVTAKLIELLRSGKVGDQLTDEQLQQDCGKDCRPGGPGYGSLTTAIRRVERDHSLVWRRVRGADMIACYDDVEKCGLVRSELAKVKRRSRKALLVANQVDREKLNGEDVSVFLANSAILGTITLMTAPNTIKKLSARKTEVTPDLPRLLAAFQKM